MPTSNESAMLAHYARGEEAGRLDEPFGMVEFERTKEIVLRQLPPAPAVVADVGGGPGRYTKWLAELGYDVRHRDLTPGHVEQVAALVPGIDTAVGDARALDFDDGSLDAVLLLGPLYHLNLHADRVRALAEAARVLKPGGPVFASAINRFAPRLHWLFAERVYVRYPQATEFVSEVERTGDLPPLFEGSFCGYLHRPDELAGEVVAAGLEIVDLVGVEGLAFAVADLTERMSDERDRTVVLETARAIERVPELLGASPHLVVTARRLV